MLARLLAIRARVELAEQQVESIEVRPQLQRLREVPDRLRVLGTRDHADLVAGALRYEHSVHDAEHHCWLDLRDTTPERYSMIAWCHGAPGIALARVDLAGYLDDSATLDRDLGDAITGMLEFGLTGEVISGVGNHSICHGDLGNSEALLLAARARGDGEVARQAMIVGSSVLAHIEQAGWLCGVPLGAETPGLMSGVAGIGYNLLRLAMPERIPSVLLVEPPRTAGRGSAGRG